MISFLYLTSFGCIVVFLIRSIIKDKYLTIFNVFLFTLSFLYLLVPGLMFLFGKSKSTLSNVIITSTDNQRINSYIYIMTMICIILLAKIKFRHKVKFNNECKCSLIRVEEYNRIVYTVCVKWFWVLFIIGIIGFLMMASQIGLTGFIKYSGKARGADAELSGSMIGYGKFLAKFMIASLSPGIMIFETSKKNAYKILLVFVFVLSFMLEIFIAGKSNFILFLLPFLMRIIGRNKESIDFKKIALIGTVALCLVFVLDNWFYKLETGESVNQYRNNWTIDQYFIRYLHEYIYPYSNLLLSKKMNQEFGYRLFVDYLAVVINFIPATLLNGFQIKLLYPEVTKCYEIISLSESAGVPADFLTFCIRQLGIIGVLVIPFCRSKLFQCIDSHMFRVKMYCDAMKINAFHILTCCSAFGFVSVLIEPYSAISTQPILFTSIIIIIQLSNRFYNAE